MSEHVKMQIYSRKRELEIFLADLCFPRVSEMEKKQIYLEGYVITGDPWINTEISFLLAPRRRNAKKALLNSSVARTILLL